MPIPAFPSIVEVRRPYGGAVLTSLPCRIVPAMWGGRKRQAGSQMFQCTHWIDCPAGSNIKDFCGRTPGLNDIVYGDGDEVRWVSSGRAYRGVVVWVEDRFVDTATEFRRAYVLREQI